MSGVAIPLKVEHVNSPESDAANVPESQPKSPDAILPSPGTSREIVLDAIGRLWWVALVRGVLLVLLGGYAFLQPELTAVVYMQVVGIFIVLDGVLAIVAGLMGETETDSRMWTIGRGALAILVGGLVTALAYFVAAFTLTFMAILLAITAISNGFMEIVVAIRHRKEIDGEGWLVVAGLLSIAFGVIIAIAPLDFGLILLQVLGVFAILAGVWLILLAFRMKGLKGNL